MVALRSHRGSRAWSSFPARAALALLALPACNLVIGGEDKVFVPLEAEGDAGTGGSAGRGGAGGDGEGGAGLAGGGNGGSPVSGGMAGMGGSGGTGGQPGGGSGGSPVGGAGGSPGNGGSAGASGSGAGGTAAGGSAGGSAGGGAGGSPGPVYTGPGQIDCETPPTAGTHRFCTDFDPLPSGWDKAGCSAVQAEKTNTLWRWQQDAGSICGTFVNISLGSAQSAATMAMWVKLDGLALGDAKIALMHVRLGETTKGEVAIRIDRDVGGTVTGTTLVVQTVEATPQVQVVGAFPATDWRHVRLRVASNGQVRATYGTTTADVIAGAEVAATAGAAAPPYLEMPFRQTAAGTGVTKILIDDLTVDVE
jgi:hypothetical protein